MLHVHLAEHRVSSHGGLLQRLAGLLHPETVNRKWIKTLGLLFAAQLPYADDDTLVELYRKVGASPHTSTKALLKTQHDVTFTFNGLFNPGVSSRYMPHIL